MQRISDFQIRRIKKIIAQLIDEYKLNLKGLNVYTEAASGHYLFNSILTACAGADFVYAYTRNSQYGSAKEIASQTAEMAELFGVTEKIQIVFEKKREHIEKSNIITNTGFVRPFTEEFISWMTNYSVIPLMWETWEFRADEFDIEACQLRNIPVIGTQESMAPCDMSLYNGFTALKLLFELGFEGYKTNVLLMGSAPTPGGAIFRQLSTIGVNVTWFSSSAESLMQYDTLNNYFEENGASFDVILLAEHKNPVCIIGEKGLITFNQIKRINPTIAIGVISGNVEIENLKKANIYYLPEKIYPFGFMSYQPSELGPKPVLDLYAAGLKVGEIAANERLKNSSVEQTINATLKYGIGHDFPGGFMNYGK